MFSSVVLDSCNVVSAEKTCFSLSSTKTHTVVVERTSQPRAYGFGEPSWDGKTEVSTCGFKSDVMQNFFYSYYLCACQAGLSESDRRKVVYSKAKYSG